MGSYPFFLNCFCARGGTWSQVFAYWQNPRPRLTRLRSLRLSSPYLWFYQLKQKTGLCQSFSSILVPEVGLEPTSLAALDFESSTFANFVTLALCGILESLNKFSIKINLMYN